MMNGQLADLQDAFQKRLLTGSDALDGYLPEHAHIGVYDNAYRVRLLNVLAEDYQALHTLLGDDAFGELINGFLDSNPSTRRSVRWLGAPLSGWMRKTEPWNGLPEAIDMAAFEWGLGLAFDAPDASVLAQADLGAIAPEDWPALGFAFHPALQVISLGHDVTVFQQAIAAEEEPEAAPQALARKTHWAIWRDHEELTVRFRQLEADEAAMLTAARQGADFAVLCETIAGTHGDETPMRAAGLVLNWVVSGWISQLVKR